MNVKTQSWDTIRSKYEDWAKSGIGVHSMLPLLDWIRCQKLESELFPSWIERSTNQLADLSMCSMILSDVKDFKHGENMLVVTPWRDGGEEKITFTHIKHSGSKDKTIKIARENETIESLRLILAYKFGIHRSPAKTEAASANS